MTTSSTGSWADKDQVLARIGLFEGISEANRRALAGICLPKRVAKGETLFLEGRKGLAVYVLVAGSVQLYKSGPDGRRVVIKLVRQGEMFGEVVLFEQNTYPVSAVALKESLLYMVPRHQFLCLLEDRAFRSDFLRNLMTKLRYLADQIKYLTAHDVQQRLLAFLADQYGRSAHITVPVSKKDVAGAMGVTPETLSRVLLRMGAQGLLSWKGRVVSVSPAAWDRLSAR